MRAWRLAAAAGVAAFLGITAPATAGVLIQVTDNNPNNAYSRTLNDEANMAVKWTQTVGMTGISVQAGVRTGNPTAETANWWLTTVLGPAATQADVVASGVYTLPKMPLVTDFNQMPLTTIATGLDLAAGTYYLVLGGPVLNGDWQGDPANSVALAPGFTLDNFYFANSNPAAFTPSGEFTSFSSVGSSNRYAFALTSEPPMGGVPEPGTWALMVLGFGSAGAMLRRRRSSAFA